MADFFNTKGVLSLSIGEGYLSSFEISILKTGDVVRTTRLAGNPAIVLFNGMPLCNAEIVILSGKEGSLFGLRIANLDFQSSYEFGPCRKDDVMELLPFMVSLGSIRISLAELKGAGHNSIISLGRPWGLEEDSELIVAGNLVARGKVVVIEEEFGIRVTEIVRGEFMEDNIRASGFLIDSTGLDKRIKDYDFRRPDKFSRNQIMKIRDIHGLFLRNLLAKLPEMASVLSTGPAGFVVDQCTYGEALDQMKKSGIGGRLIAECLPWKRAAPSGSSGDGGTEKLLIEEQGTSHPVHPAVHDLISQMVELIALYNRSPVYLYFKDAPPLSGIFNREESRAAVLSCLRGGWKHLVDLGLRQIPAAETGARSLDIHKNEMVIMVSFGPLWVVYPYLTLEPFLRILG